MIPILNPNIEPDIEAQKLTQFRRVYPARAYTTLSCVVLIEMNEMKCIVTDVYKCSMLANFIGDSLDSLRCTRAWESWKAAVGNIQSILSLFVFLES